MSTNNIPELLGSFVEHGSETAFRELVTRYIDLVYSTALRQVNGNAPLAEEVVQTVFADLARKASSLPRQVLLGGWLHRHTGFVASTMLRGEIRRQLREQEAAAMNLTHDPAAADWHQVATLLDDAIEQLEPADRDAITLRYLEQRDLRSVGLVLGVSDDTAQKRVSRAVEKLRAMLLERGATLTVATLGTLLGAQLVEAAPPYLAAKVSKGALATIGAGMGTVAAFLKWLATPIGKVAMSVGLVAVVTVGVVQQRLTGHQEVEVPKVESRMAATNRTVAAAPTSVMATKGNQARPGVVALPTANPNSLRVIFLNAENDKPLRNVPVEVSDRVAGKQALRKLKSNGNGILELDVDRANTTELQITTRTMNYADTRLFWRPDRGESVPTNYTVRLVRGVAMGGQVVGPEGEPIANASVTFNSDMNPVTRLKQESHDYFYLTVKTDNDGRWQIRRIAEEMVGQSKAFVRHPDYLSTHYVRTADTDREMMAAMRAGTHVFKMVTPMTVVGEVMDEAGKPILNAWVMVGGAEGSGQTTAKTDESGTFKLTPCRPEDKLLSAEAEGFGATTVNMEVKPGMAPVRIMLKRGQALKLQVVDKGSKPVAGAKVTLNTSTFNPFKAPGETPKVQSKFSATTDAEGRVVWGSAPDTELAFHIQATGHMRKMTGSLRPAAQEHVVKLAPALVVSGTVVDAVSGEPVPKFRIISGYPSVDRSSSTLPNAVLPMPTTNVFWSINEQHWFNFAGGKFRHVFEEPMVYAVNDPESNPGYVLKFEADGYGVQTSRAIQADEGEARLEIRLRPVKATVVTVLLPDGRPAAKVDVGLVTSGSGLVLSPSGFDRKNPKSGRALLLTDVEGKFTLPADDAIQRVVGVCAEGFGETTVAGLVANPVLRLQTWGLIKGVYFYDGKPATGTRLQWKYRDDKFDTIYADPRVYDAVTDEQGQFEFAKVPPGQHKILRLIPSTIGTMSMSRAMPFSDVVIRPGETTTLTVNQSIYNVAFRVEMPEGMEQENQRKAFAMLSTAFPAPYRDLDTSSAAYREWIQSAEYRQWGTSRVEFRATKNSEGTYTAEGVPPGTYDLAVRLNDPQNPMGRALAFKKTLVIVPEGAPGKVIEVGSVVLNQTLSK